MTTVGDILYKQQHESLPPKHAHIYTLFIYFLACSRNNASMLKTEKRKEKKERLKDRQSIEIETRDVFCSVPRKGVQKLVPWTWKISREPAVMHQTNCPLVYVCMYVWRGDDRMT